MAIGRTELIWLSLIGLTLVGALLTETRGIGWPLTFTVAALIAVKGSLVIDHYMEMRCANKRIRNVLRLFVILIPLMVIISHGWGSFVRELTTIY
ncbi:MAG: cytochrome C oxidase subunit IV family protein [Candidatus Thiodiazotropha sp. (ex Monitilora ramsayi)]|nr:cytochrome C oxidase subunit IV family protein [Candidatus Thiodiazotropha sp. (ex Monitilora ramsayi)]